MSFWYFEQQKLDLVIIETGLGGRLDSTNIITPLISVITNISRDHTNILGDTLEEIAHEKAGIIKYRVPVVIGNYQKDIAHVFLEKAKNESAPLFYADDLVKLTVMKNDINCKHIQIKGYFHQKESINTSMLAPYYENNLKTAIASLVTLKEFNSISISYTSLQYANLNLRHLTGYKGRWELLSKQPFIIAESAHNEAGLQFVIDYVLQYKFDQIYFILGFVKDKEYERLLSLFPAKAMYFYVTPSIERGLNSLELMAVATKLGLTGESVESIEMALKKSLKKASSQDAIVVTGSTFLIADLMKTELYPGESRVK